jgi:hypothetical protein
VDDLTRFGVTFAQLWATSPKRTGWGRFRPHRHATHSTRALKSIQNHIKKSITIELGVAFSKKT